MKFATVVAILFCCALPVLAGDKDEEINTITVYGLKVPAVRTKEKPREEAIESFEKAKGNKSFLEAREKLILEIKKIQTAGGEPDPKKKKRAVEDALKKLDTAAKKFFKEAAKLRKKYDPDLAKLQAEKDKVDRDIEKAEETGNDKLVTKLAQSFDKKNSKYESLKNSILLINSYLIFEELPEIASIVEECNLKTVPDILKLAEMFDDAANKKDDKADKQKKNDKEDDDKKDKKRNKKKNKKGDD